MLEPHTSALTPRLEVRCPTELDRPRFVELFCDDAFMAFSGGPLAADQAHARFDRMLARCVELSFAKQPVVGWSGATDSFPRLAARATPRRRASLSSRWPATITQGRSLGSSTPTTGPRRT
jgi:hypothetical protein